MKYIYGVLALAILASLAIAYLVRGQAPKATAYALKINDRVISLAEFKAIAAVKAGTGDGRDLVEELIMKELLIQEAKKQGIDQEESFRRTMQNFYEQSLTKVLMDRMFAPPENPPEEKLVDRFLALQGQRVTIVMNNLDSAPAGEGGGGTAGESRQTLFEQLPSELKVVVAALPIGGQSEPLELCGGRHTVTLAAVEEGGAAVEMVWPREKAVKIIQEYQKEQRVSQWLQGLRAKAQIQNTLPQ